MEIPSQETNFLITDIKIFNHSFSKLPVELQQKISPVMPTYTSKIELPHKYNNFSIEFAALTYKNPELNRYAYGYRTLIGTGSIRMQTVALLIITICRAGHILFS